MTGFEILRLACAPALPPLAWRVRRELRRLWHARISDKGRPVALLDIGARRSPYTIALNAKVTLLDVPRKEVGQEQLDLGASSKLVDRTHRRRSNVVEYRLEDFLSNTLDNRAFEIVTAVEVIEHVVDDNSFIREAARVVTQDGFIFFSTPNGDDIPVPSPQHVRHYTKQRLESICRRHFEEVFVYPVLRRNCLWSLCHGPLLFGQPLQLAATVSSNVLYKLTRGARDKGTGISHHLFAVLGKPLDRRCRG